MLLGDRYLLFILILSAQILQGWLIFELCTWWISSH